MYLKSLFMTEIKVSLISLVQFLTFSIGILKNSDNSNVDQSSSTVPQT